MNDNLPWTDTSVADVERLALRTPTVPPATHTNSFLVGASDFVVVEPASPYAPEQRQLEALVRARIAEGRTLLGVVLTHHHPDHVGGADALRRAFGVPVMAHARTRDKLAGRLAVDEVLEDGDTRLASVGLDVVLTPGHAPGHLCFRHARRGWVLAGDMVASVGTILIDPDDGGDMDDYLRALERLRALKPTVLLPAHGDPIVDADERLGFYVSHRLQREAKVLAAVGARPTDLAAIVANAYADTSPVLWALAARSARAHLERLRRLGKITAATAPEQWKLV